MVGDYGQGRRVGFGKCMGCIGINGLVGHGSGAHVVVAFRRNAERRTSKWLTLLGQGKKARILTLPWNSQRLCTVGVDTGLSLHF